MLNVLRSSKLELRNSWNETIMALGLGLLISVAIIALQEADAQQEMAAQLFKEPNMAAELNQDKISEGEVAQARLELTELKSRVNYLMLRQEEREDLMDVQAILMAQAWGQKGVVGELKSLQWQQGTLEFEGLSLRSDDWRTLLIDIHLFDRWKTEPQIFRAHSALKKPSPSANSRPAKSDFATSELTTSEFATPQEEIKLKAKLWAHASNSLLAKSAP